MQQNKQKQQKCKLSVLFTNIIIIIFVVMVKKFRSGVDATIWPYFITCAGLEMVF